MGKDVRVDDAHGDNSAAPRCLGRLVLLSYYNSYPSSKIHHFCTSQWYLLVLEQLQRFGWLDGAEAWFVSDKPMEFVIHGVTVRCFASFEEMAHAAHSTDILWVRGKCRAYLEVLNRMAARIRVYYPASKRFISRAWNHFDVVLVDDQRQIAPVARLGAARFVHRVIKTADPEIFKPLDGIVKSHDLCMIGGMHITRKNHGALVGLLRADPSLTAVVIGKKTDDTVQQLTATGAHVKYIDFCSRDELNRIMNDSRIGFVPSLMDAAPRVILEYMSAGVPVLLNSAILGGRDYITPETGMLASETEFLDATHRLRQGLSAATVRRGFEQNFSPERAARHLGSILINAMDRLGRTRPVAPPSWVRRVVSRPWLLKKRLARCWREIAAQ